jgi:hypothetical protein
VLDHRGHVRPVALQQEARGEAPGLGADATGCLKVTGDRLTFPLEEQVSGSPLFVSVTYDLTEVSDPPVRTRALALGEDGEWAYNAWSFELPAGQNTLLIPLLPTSWDIGAVALGELTPGTPICVTDVSVVRPVYDDGGGKCVGMDRYAVRTSPVTCPTTDPTP